MPDALGWIWLVLFVAITAVRKAHERRAGHRSTLAGNPHREAVLMLAWGMAAGIMPLVWLFSDWLEVADLAVPTAVRALGVPPFLFAIWLLHRAHADLGTAWTPQVEPGPAQGLVTTGVFAHVRHPMYAAHLLWGIGQALLLPNLLAGPLALILMLPLLALRIPREEQAMLGEFGDAYRAYMERTPRLVPCRGALRPFR